MNKISKNKKRAGPKEVPALSFCGHLTELMREASDLLKYSLLLQSRHLSCTVETAGQDIWVEVSSEVLRTKPREYELHQHVQTIALPLLTDHETYLPLKWDRRRVKCYRLTLALVGTELLVCSPYAFAQDGQVLKYPIRPIGPDHV